MALGYFEASQTESDRKRKICLLRRFGDGDWTVEKAIVLSPGPAFRHKSVNASMPSFWK